MIGPVRKPKQNKRYNGVWKFKRSWRGVVKWLRLIQYPHDPYSYVRFNDPFTGECRELLVSEFKKFYTRIWQETQAKIKYGFETKDGITYVPSTERDAPQDWSEWQKLETPEDANKHRPEKVEREGWFVQ